MGGFADVWHGKVHDADVAIKVWRLGGHGADVLKDFCKEAAVLKYLRHPNVTRLVGVETTVFPMCLVCEWMPLGTLNSFLERHPGANRLALLVDVAAGLTYLHALDIVHGDLKGANILINARRSACLADFGLAAFSYENRTAYIPTRSVNAGTTRWIAPEVMDPEAFGLERARVSRESDVYAFAMVMWEAFTGRVPFPSIQRDAAVMHKVIGGGRPTRPFQATDLGLSDAVWDIVERCWQGDRGARPIISQVRDQLEQVVDVVEDLGAPQEWPLDVA
ncbi:hypothetical protein CERSUDRAFT_145024 [Gelatoporia subvermispora B]|uniref:Protein kinase domain-containing protein n=1 Tax=Ceriporiopsis subvermispora (strain B) TaxID=914234 RepID=M2P834_CERS8|nr:hypothetical protein CERSUDRAFT_145024 [Gelatoporia subvermispora B]